MLTCPNASTTSSRARIRFAATSRLEFDSIREPGGVLCEPTRSKGPNRKDTECCANELTACHAHVRRHGPSQEESPLATSDTERHERSTTLWLTMYDSDRDLIPPVPLRTFHQSTEMSAAPGPVVAGRARVIALATAGRTA